MLVQIQMEQSCPGILLSMLVLGVEPIPLIGVAIIFVSIQNYSLRFGRDIRTIDLPTT